jgi:hypothetical protein
MNSSTARPRFPGLKLSAKDRKHIAKTMRGSIRSRTWKRMRMLQMLDAGDNLTETAKALGTYPREVRRVGWRYLDRGLEAALQDEPRPHPPKLLDAMQEAAVVAMVCAPPPDGHARWSVVLATVEAQRRGIAKKVGRETIRRVLADHELKPWREKNVVRAGAGRRVHRQDGGRVEPPGETVR